MVTIGQLTKQSGLSRSTLLYYDKIGLLKPSSRSSSGYRLYTDKDQHRLEQILLYREVGLSLETIIEVLNSSRNSPSKALKQRLLYLNKKISRVRQQQQLIVELLGEKTLLKKAKIMNKDQWVKILKATGMDENAMHQWHIEFERDLPEVHSDFLESLGIDEKEIKRIKDWSRTSRNYLNT